MAPVTKNPDSGTRVQTCLPLSLAEQLSSAVDGAVVPPLGASDPCNGGRNVPLLHVSDDGQQRVGSVFPEVLQAGHKLVERAKYALETKKPPNHASPRHAYHDHGRGSLTHVRGKVRGEGEGLSWKLSHSSNRRLTAGARLRKQI